MPSATITSRTWRTRPDPFAEVWATEIEPYLRTDEDGELLATTLMDELCRRHPEDFQPGQVRTLQRQIRRWRALHGRRQEVLARSDRTVGPPQPSVYVGKVYSPSPNRVAGSIAPASPR